MALEMQLAWKVKQRPAPGGNGAGYSCTCRTISVDAQIAKNEYPVEKDINGVHEHERSKIQTGFTNAVPIAKPHIKACRQPQAAPASKERRYR